MKIVYLLKHGEKVIYVGAGNRDRIKNHFYAAKKSNTPVHKYMRDVLSSGGNITFDVVAEIDQASALRLEVQLIARHHKTVLNAKKPFGYREEDYQELRDAFRGVTFKRWVCSSAGGEFCAFVRRYNESLACYFQNIAIKQGMNRRV